MTAFTVEVVRQWVMNRMAEHGAEVSFAPAQILAALTGDEGTLAAAMLPEALLSLIWEGRLVVTGPWRVRLPRPEEAKVKPPELIRLERAKENVVAAAEGWAQSTWDDGDACDVALGNAVRELKDAEEAVKGKNG